MSWSSTKVSWSVSKSFSEVSKLVFGCLSRVSESWTWLLFVWCKTTAIGHHFCKFSIIEHFSLVCTILHPYDSLVVMIRLVESFLHSSNNQVAILNFNSIYLYQNGWHYFSEAMSLNKLVVYCTSEYDKALVSPVLSLIPTTNLPPCELLNATNSQAISYLSRMRSLNCTPDTSPAYICFDISSIIL